MRSFSIWRILQVLEKWNREHIRDMIEKNNKDKNKMRKEGKTKDNYKKESK